MAWNRIQCMVIIKPQKVVFNCDFHIHVFNIKFRHHPLMGL